MLSNTDASYDAMLYDVVEGTGQEANAIIEAHPHFLANKKYVLEYTNVKGTKFYTVFDGSKANQSAISF